jgi:hypothetical protein
MGPDKEGKDISVNWNCNTLISHESDFHSDAEIIDAFSEHEQLIDIIRQNFIHGFMPWRPFVVRQSLVLLV